MIVTKLGATQYKQSVTNFVEFCSGTGRNVIITTPWNSNHKSWTIKVSFKNGNFHPSAMGKTFWSPDEVIAHYKTMRFEMLEAIKMLNKELEVLEVIG